MAPPPCRKCKTYCFFGDTPCPEDESDLRQRIADLEGELRAAMLRSIKSHESAREFRTRVRELASRLPRTPETSDVVDALLALAAPTPYDDRSRMRDA